MTTSRLQERPVASRSSRIRVLATSLLLLVAAVPVSAVQASEPALDARPPAVIADPQGSVQPTIQYEEALAHAGDRIPFTAGERVTVPFKPRGSDRWTVADEPPRSLPAGRLSGRAIRAGVAVPRFDPKASATDVSSRGGRTGRPALGGPRVGTSCGPGSRGQSGRPPSRSLRLPALLGADRPVDQARLVDALDDRLLRGRRRRQRGSPAQERRRIDDRGLERLDELEADRGHQRRPRQRHARRADRPELRLDVDRA